MYNLIYHWSEYKNYILFMYSNIICDVTVYYTYITYSVFIGFFYRNLCEHNKEKQNKM